MDKKEKRQEIAVKWQEQIKLGIKGKESEKEDIKKEIEEIKFKVDRFRLVNNLIKNAMAERIILINGVDISCDPTTLDRCMNKCTEEEKELYKQLKDKNAELSNLVIEIIIDYQKLIVLKKDLEELD